MDNFFRMLKRIIKKFPTIKINKYKLEMLVVGCLRYDIMRLSVFKYLCNKKYIDMLPYGYVHGFYYVCLEENNREFINYIRKNYVKIYGKRFKCTNCIISMTCRKLCKRIIK